jgi:HSP20 family molecular chaperone IbpA
VKKEKQYVQRERSRSMNRTIPLRGPIAEDVDLSARYEKGVLTVQLPKGEEDEDSGRQIEIE